MEQKSIFEETAAYPIEKYGKERICFSEIIRILFGISWISRIDGSKKLDLRYHENF
jgi:hypothetical protein